MSEFVLNSNLESILGSTKEKQKRRQSVASIRSSRKQQQEFNKAAMEAQDAELTIDTPSSQSEGMSAQQGAALSSALSSLGSQAGSSSPLASSASMAGTGALIGSAFGATPQGAIVGAGVGLYAGIKKKRAERKRREAELRAQNLEALSQIEAASGKERAAALQNIGRSIANAFKV